MNQIRQNAFHIVTVILFLGMIVHCRQSPDMAGWLTLFSLVILNAFLFIFKTPISMISWFTTVICILGIIMSLPVLMKTGIGFIHENTGNNGLKMGSLDPTAYFMISIIFSVQQIKLLIK